MYVVKSFNLVVGLITVVNLGLRQQATFDNHKIYKITLQLRLQCLLVFFFGGEGVNRPSHVRETSRSRNVAPFVVS